MRLRKLTTALASVATAIIAGCGGGSQPQADEGGERPWKAAILLPGQISDRGWNEIGYNGLMRLRDEMGMEVMFSEDTRMVNWDRVIRGFIADGANIVLLHGLEFEDAVRTYAPQYPHVYFLVSNAVNMAGTNYASVGVQTEQAAFLTGIVGGMMTKSGRTGAIVGFEYPLMVGQAEAFRLGVRSVNPEASSESVILGSLFDPVLGKEAARAMIGRGVDVIWQLANSAGLGILQAAEEEGVQVIGWGVDQRPLAPTAVLTTQKVDVGDAFVIAVRDIVSGAFAENPQPYEFGVESTSTGLGPFNDSVPPEVVAEAERWRRAIAEGAVVVPKRMPMNRSQQAEPLVLPPGY